MLARKIIKGEPIELNISEEIELTRIVGQIVLESRFKVIAYNICSDHIHLLLVCHENGVTSQIQKLKSISSKRFHRSVKITSHKPSEHNNHLWSQKFYYCHLDEWSLETLSRTPGEMYKESHFTRTINYIVRNRIKHGLQFSAELQEIIASFVVTIDDAYDF